MKSHCYTSNNDIDKQLNIDEEDLITDQDKFPTRQVFDWTNGFGFG